MRYWERKRHPERFGSSGDLADENQDLCGCRLTSYGQRILLISLYSGHFFVLPLLHFLVSKLSSASSSSLLAIIFNPTIYDVLLHQLIVLIGIYAAFTVRWRLLVVVIFLLIIAIFCDILLMKLEDEFRLSLLVNIFIWALIAAEISVSHSLAKHWKRLDQIPHDPEFEFRGNQRYHLN